MSFLILVAVWCVPMVAVYLLTVPLWRPHRETHRTEKKGV